MPVSLVHHRQRNPGLRHALRLDDRHTRHDFITAPIADGLCNRVAPGQCRNGGGGGGSFKKDSPVHADTSWLRRTLPPKKARPEPGLDGSEKLTSPLLSSCRWPSPSPCPFSRAFPLLAPASPAPPFPRAP